VNETATLESATLETGPLVSAGDYSSWQVRSACRGVDTELFYSADFARGAPKRKQEAAAKAVCAVCPVIEQCLARALEVGEAHGIWGGLNPEERIALRKPRDIFAA
jgi:WhiB family redox-sensing transcriptional regulator